MNDSLLALIVGYLLGWIVGHGGWQLAGEIQMSLFCFLGANLALALRPSEMSH